MKSFQVITDSTCDVEYELRQKHNLDYIQMTFTINSVKYDANLDWNNISQSEFFGLMREGKRFTTERISVERFYDCFEAYLKQGIDILYIACSSKLSGSLNNAKIAATMLFDSYPDRKIICVDSLRSNYSLGMMACEAAKLSNEGESLDDVYRRIYVNRTKYQTIALVDSLKRLKLAGRVKSVIGDLLGFKPIIVSDSEGNNFAYKTIRGRKQALNDLCNILSQLSFDNEHAIYIEHADCIEDALYLKRRLGRMFEDVEIHVSSVGPVVGATVGPNAITLNFYNRVNISALEK